MNALLILGLIGGAGWLFLQGRRNAPGHFTEGTIIGTPKPGEVWTLSLRASRALTDADQKTLLDAFAALGQVMGVTKTGDRNNVTLRWTATGTTLRQNRLVWDDGTVLELMGAARAPVS